VSVTKKIYWADCQRELLRDPEYSNWLKQLETTFSERTLFDEQRAQHEIPSQDSKTIRRLLALDGR